MSIVMNYFMSLKNLIMNIQMFFIRCRIILKNILKTRKVMFIFILE